MDMLNGLMWRRACSQENLLEIAAHFDITAQINQGIMRMNVYGVYARQKNFETTV
jgi:hypothetical protein